MLTVVERLVGAQEIGAMLGVSRQRVQQLIHEDDWPAPAVELAMGKAWKRDDIVAWARKNDRQIADDE